MSEEMAVSDNTTGDEAKVSNDEASTATVAEPEEVAVEAPSEPVAPAAEESPALAEDNPDPEIEPKIEKKPEVKEEPESDYPDVPLDNPEVDLDIKKEEDIKDEIETFEHNIEEVLKKGIKRRASSAFSDVDDEEFKGFDETKLEIKAEDYSRILERLEAEVTAASKDFVPLKTVMATPPAPGRASKRPRKDTEGSRPSSALSSRSDDGPIDSTSSPAQRGGRRATTEMSSPLLRVPLERGWKRELVYRAALDTHSRRNADIYYYTPYGKKLRSTREVSEHLAGTGLTPENFSFFKEPLGVDDPEKEIIRDAKLMRRVESPVAASVPAAPLEGKRTPKPKPPKGASPEPAPPANKSPPAKIKVKSVGSRLSNSAPPAAPTPPAKQQKKPPQQQQQQPPTPTTVSNTDNNNSAAWKKPSCNDLPRRGPSGPDGSAPARPPPLQARPAPPAAPAPPPDATSPGGRAVQPCSMSCGRGAVPSLSCAACLCLYHPACAGHLHAAPPHPFFCKNCRKSSSPPIEPPPLTHKSGVATSIPVPMPVPVPVSVLAPVPRRVPVPVPVPVPAKVPRDKRVLLRMKVAGGTPDGERVWAVAGVPPVTQAAPSPSPAPAPVPAAAPLPAAIASRGRAPRPALPQGLAILNGRRFVVVPRNMVHAAAGHAAK